MNNEDLILESKTFREMDLPPTLYKYRDWTEEKHKRVLTHNELFFAPPALFEDEFDCKVPIRYDLMTDEEIYEKYLNSSKEENPHFTRQQHRKFARDWQKKGLLRDKRHLEDIEKEFSEKFNNLFGVLSLTAIHDNYEMWNKYANKGKGFCIGFRTIPLFELSQYFGGGGEVIYYDELPIIKESDPLEKKHFLQIHSKLRIYEFEKEYRVTKFNIKNRKATIPNNIFVEIIIGDKMTDEMKNEIIELAKQKFSHVSISIANFNDKDKLVTINPW